MTENWTEAEKEAYFAPGEADANDMPPHDDQSRDDYSSQPEFTLFDAPDYALFIRHHRTDRGKEYEQKVASMLKATALASFRNGNVVDGCAVLHYGPAFAKKCGDLTDVSPGAAQAIDLLAVPDNPWVGFGLIAIPFMLQLFRNHQQQAQIVGQTFRERRAERKRAKAEGLTSSRQKRGRPVTLRFPFGRKLTFHIALPAPAFMANIMYAQTREPRDLARQVLSDERLVKALAKEGIQFTRKSEPQ